MLNKQLTERRKEKEIDKGTETQGWFFFSCTLLRHDKRVVKFTEFVLLSFFQRNARQENISVSLSACFLCCFCFCFEFWMRFIREWTTSLFIRFIGFESRKNAFMITHWSRNDGCLCWFTLFFFLHFCYSEVKCFQIFQSFLDMKLF